MNSPPTNNLKSKDTEIAIAPAAIPPRKKDLVEGRPNFWIT
jgi:hypothetical protein